MENLLLVFQYLGYTFIRLIQNDHSKAQNVILFFFFGHAANCESSEWATLSFHLNRIGPL